MNKPCGWDIQAELRQCEYCGKKTDVVPDPFGQKPACLECFGLLIGDEP